MREGLPGPDSEEDLAAQLASANELLEVGCLMMEELLYWEHYPWHEGNIYVKTLDADIAETQEAIASGEITLIEGGARAVVRARKNLNTVRLLRKRRKKNPDAPF